MHFPVSVPLLPVPVELLEVDPFFEAEVDEEFVLFAPFFPLLLALDLGGAVRTVVRR